MNGSFFLGHSDRKSEYFLGIVVFYKNVGFLIILFQGYLRYFSNFSRNSENQINFWKICKRRKLWYFPRLKDLFSRTSNWNESISMYIFNPFFTKPVCFFLGNSSKDLPWPISWIFFRKLLCDNGLLFWIFFVKGLTCLNSWFFLDFLRNFLA